MKEMTKWIQPALILAVVILTCVVCSTRDRLAALERRGPAAVYRSSNVYLPQELDLETPNISPRMPAAVCIKCSGVGFINDPCAICGRTGRHKNGATCMTCSGTGIIPRACSCRK